MNTTNKKLDADGFRRAKSARARHLSKRPPHGNGIPKNKKPYYKPLTSMGRRILCSLPPSPDYHKPTPTLAEVVACEREAIHNVKQRELLTDSVRLVLATESERVNRARKWFVYGPDDYGHIVQLNRFAVDYADAVRLQQRHITQLCGKAGL